ncbi:SoxR reducing system RseC family protein [Candidatus Erwinia haradaeae]|uniref:Protein RseC, partial n=1 Tax=Candidatus Erwinia haradaeae TaxID=1922217 RepID=A0A451D8S8_9GAMM|nr:SoxR reducing system RseC family protein [Candidatus Erwinia haradaeae]VFP82251.1 Protein RseC [Candidatus Erwinia haradaeae]
MIRVWATVIKYHNGFATLYIEKNRSCINCISCTENNKNRFKKNTSKNLYIIEVYSYQALAPKQQIQIGLSKSSMLITALLIYLTPLMSLLLSGILFQIFLKTDLAAIIGVLLGGISGFLLTKWLSVLLMQSPSFQPVIIYSSILSRSLKLSIKN